MKKKAWNNLCGKVDKDVWGKGYHIVMRKLRTNRMNMKYWCAIRGVTEGERKNVFRGEIGNKSGKNEKWKNARK